MIQVDMHKLNELYAERGIELAPERAVEAFALNELLATEPSFNMDIFRWLLAELMTPASLAGGMMQIDTTKVHPALVAEFTELNERMAADPGFDIDFILRISAAIFEDKTP